MTPLTALVLAVLAVLPATHATPTWATHDNLLRRQGPPPASLPQQCQSVCKDPMTTLTTCKPARASCLCPPAVQKGLFDCFMCIGNATGNTDFRVPQIDVDALTSQCNAQGRTLPKLTFPGQDPNRPLATAPVSGSATPTGITSFSANLPSVTTVILPPTPTSPGATVTASDAAPTSSQAGSGGLGGLNGAKPARMSEMHIVGAGVLLAMIMV